MKKLFLAFTTFLFLGSTYASCTFHIGSGLEDPWTLSLNGVTIKRSLDLITYEHNRNDFSVLPEYRVEGKEVTFSKNDPRPGTFPVQDITITTLMTYKEYVCGVANLFGGMQDDRNPLATLAIGMLYGTTFVFENGNTVTVAHHFCAYETKHACNKPATDNFEDYSRNAQMGPVVRPFKRAVEPYCWNLLASAAKRFMGFAPSEDGVLDTRLKLEDLRSELTKLGRIVSETTDQIRLDNKYPKVFEQWYSFLDLNYDEFMRRKSSAVIIPSSGGLYRKP
jgi:hypothetical protein